MAFESAGLSVNEREGEALHSSDSMDNRAEDRILETNQGKANTGGRKRQKANCERISDMLYMK